MLYLLPSTEKYPNGQSKRIELLLMLKKNIFIFSRYSDYPEYVPLKKPRRKSCLF